MSQAGRMSSDHGGGSTAGEISFLAYKSATTVNATGDGTLYPINADAIINNDGGAYAAGVFTAPVDVLMEFTGCVRFSNLDSAHTLCIVPITTSGSAMVPQFFFNPFSQSAGGDLSYTFDFNVQLDAGDTLEIAVQIFGGTNTVGVTGPSGNIMNTYLSGFSIKNL